MAGSAGFLTSALARKWARHRLRRREKRNQADVLVGLLRAAQNTRFGRQHAFRRILESSNPYQAFRELPIQDYDDWVLWLKDQSVSVGQETLNNLSWPGQITTYCLSSGTSSGRTKFIPYSQHMIKANRKSALDLVAWLILDGLNPLTGKTLYMTGCTHLQRDGSGVLAGDMSALTRYLAPRFMDVFTLPDRTTAAIDQWSLRLEKMVEIATKNRALTMISGIPIWQLTLLEEVAAQSGRVAPVIPSLQYVIHGGMSIEPYRRRMRELLGPAVKLIEVYAASEIGIAAFQQPGLDGMTFQSSDGVFYEFEDGAGNLHRLEGIRQDTPYSAVISSCAGLWRYRIGDRLVFRSVNPPRLERVSRDKTMSAFDEKVTESECEDAMAQIYPRVTDFSVGPQIDARRHLWFIVSNEPWSQDRIRPVDDALRRLNQDYDDYHGDGRIATPDVRVISDRARFLNAIGRLEGGQRKFPRLLSPKDVESLLNLEAQR